MSHSAKSKHILLAPAPRLVADIFDSADVDELRALAELVMVEPRPVTETLFDESAADTEIIIGQIDLPESRLKKPRYLKAIFNVEGNFLPNVDYSYCFRNGI